MKFACSVVLLAMPASRAPQGARGLKFWAVVDILAKVWSRPARGAWVEIRDSVTTASPVPVAPRKGRVG